MEEKTLPPQPLDEWMLALLACSCPAHLPVHLNAEKTELICACGRYAFAIGEDGIPNMLLEEAKVLNPDADPAQVTSAEESD